METLQVESCVQGHHLYKRIWNPTVQVGQELNCVREATNSEDPYAVAAMRNRALVGHVPPKMSAASALF